MPCSRAGVEQSDTATLRLFSAAFIRENLAVGLERGKRILLQAWTANVLRRCFIILSAVLICGCESLPSVPEGRIEFRNLLSGSAYTTVHVRAGSANHTIPSGQGVLLPRGITTILVTYDNGKTTRRYTVQCPRHLTVGVRIRLIDVTQNRMEGGCVTAAVE